MSIVQAKSSVVRTGRLVTSLGEDEDVGRIVLIQSDGKIVMVGDSSREGREGSIGYNALVRYNTDGTLDKNFGKNGKVVADQGSVADAVLQHDGKIIVAGTSLGSDYYGAFKLIRYNADGTLDKTFRTVGAPEGDESTGQSVFLRAMVLQADGKILTIGATNSGAGQEIAMVRFNNNGSLDTSFGRGGEAQISFGKEYFYGGGINVQQDGKILVIGSVPSAKNDGDFALRRFNKDGTLDKAFGTGGTVVTAVSKNSDTGNEVVLQPDGKILVLGSSVDLSANRRIAELVRYNADGTLDNTFGKSGIAVVRTGSTTDVSDSLALQSDGKIVLGGKSGDGLFAEFAAVRLNADGALDKSFGENGEVTTPVGMFSRDAGYGIAIQADDKILLGGSSEGLNFDTDFALARLNGDGTLDKTFGGASVSLLASENKRWVVGLPPKAGNDELSWSIEGGTDRRLFSIDAKSGSLSFKSAPDFEAPKDAGANNVYEVTLHVIGGKIGRTETLSVRVTDVKGLILNGGKDWDTLTGGDDNDRLSGFHGNDRLYAGIGDDRLDGGADTDRMVGGWGRDTFVFSTKLDSNDNVDRITDFSHKDDTIELHADVFAALKAGTLEDFRFKVVKYGTQKEGVDKSDRILYDKDSGKLYFDQDGRLDKYKPVKFAEVKAYADISHDDFLIV